MAMSTVLGWAGALAGGRGGVRTGLGVVEARELYPLAVVLESIAIRQSPAFDAGRDRGLAGGQPAHARRGARPRRRDAGRRRLPCTAHRRLRVRAAARGAAPVKRALLRYEQVYMSEARRVERSVAQHDEIIRALERGDHAEAAQRLRRNLTGGLPDLTGALEVR